MPESVQIQGENNQYIHALHTQPEERSIEAIDKLLFIMVHGFPGSKTSHDNLFAQVTDCIDQKNYHSLCFDFRGCGESQGRQEDFTLASAAEDLENVLGWAKNKGYSKFVFIAEGLGASIVATNLPAEAICMVMFWPMIDMPNIAKTLFQSEAIEEQWLKAGYLLQDKDRIGIEFIQHLQKANISPFLKDLSRPALIMHGAEDEVSPIGQLDLIRKHAGSRRIEITTFHDGVHGLPNPRQRKMVFYHMMQFIEKYI